MIILKNYSLARTPLHGRGRQPNCEKFWRSHFFCGFLFLAVSVLHAAVIVESEWKNGFGSKFLVLAALLSDQSNG